MDSEPATSSAGTPTTLRLGRRGEDYAARRLAAAGWQLLARNARTRTGETDLIALDGVDLVFVEVKTLRLGGRFGPERAVLAIGPRKQLQIRRLAREWLASRPEIPTFEGIRFDAIGITVTAANTLADYEHIKAAF